MPIHPQTGTSSQPFHLLFLGIAGAALLVAAPPVALATDGGSAAPDEDPNALMAPAPTYYEAALGASSVESLASAAAALPDALVIEEASATAEYRAAGATADQAQWELRIEGFDRRHEQVDAIYDMVLVLPLPAAPDGRDAFTPLERGVRIEEGGAARSIPLVYGGEKMVLKRNVGIEKTLLAHLVEQGALPTLGGTGHRWTAWDTIVSRDDKFADTVQARAVLRYATAPGVAAPDAADPRLAAYLITWIPSLPASVPPYAVRIALQAAAPQ